VFRISTAILALALTALISLTIKADDPVSSNVRFNREIIRILQRRCIACHSPGGLSMPLTNYRDVRDWNRAIREEVVEQRMPPATAAPGYGRFENALGLTFRETTTLLAWLDGGMPRGDEKDLPAPIDTASITKPDPAADLHLDIPLQSIPALEEVVIRRVTIATGLTQDRLVSRVIVRPGSRALMRGAVVYEGADERSWVGAWLPWQHTLAAPPGRGFRLSEGATLTLVIYYRGAEEAATDRSSIDIYFADKAQALETFGLEAAHGAGQSTLTSPTTFWVVQTIDQPGMRSLELRATRPDGSVDVLLWVPTVRPEWPNALLMQQPVTFPANTVLTLSTKGSDGAHRARVILSGWREPPRSP
jgi:hypothetical protein